MTTDNIRPMAQAAGLLRGLGEPTGPLPAGARIGKYVIVAVLGQGGYGITYRARDPLLHHDVAIKEFFPTALARRQAGRLVTPLSVPAAALFQWGRARFLDEAQVLVRLDAAPAVGVFHDICESNGTTYVVMNLVRGETLEARLTHDRRLPPSAIERLLYPLLEGLQIAHDAGLIHADIRPANILIDSDGRPTLVDFGAARAALTGRIQSLTGAFTPGYAAPEQVPSSHLGPWTDIYGLAGTLYRAVAGVTPPDAAERLRRDALMPAADVGRGSYAPGLLAAIDAALKLSTAERPQTIVAWRHIFDADPPVAAPPSPAPTPGPAELAPERRLVVRERRHHAAPVAAAVGALVATSIGGWVVFGPQGGSPDGVQRRTLADVQPAAEPPGVPVPGDDRRARAASDAARRAAEDKEATEAATRQAAQDGERQRVAAAAQRRAGDEAARKAAEEKAAADAQRLADEEAARKAAEGKSAAEAAARQAAQDAERQRVVVEAQRRADMEGARRVAAEAAVADAARQATLDIERQRVATEARHRADEEAARKAAEQKAATEATARQHEEQARRLAEEQARTAVAAQDKADADAREKVRQDSRRRAAEFVLRTAEEAAHQEARDWPTTDAEARRRGETAESSLQLAEADRKRVQATLTSLGHEIGATTGVFGPRTRAMVAAWQKKQGLPETGYLTGLQIAVLQLQVAPALAKPVEPRPEADRRAPQADPRRAEVEEAALGLTEADRKRAQAALTSLGHEIGATTGFFGPRTRAMLAAWQKKHGLPETGFLTATQWASLQQQAAQIAAKPVEPRPETDRRAPEANPRRAEAGEAALGLTEADRKRVQVALTSLGHEIGGVTGFIGPRTRAMITAWQKKQGLAETGFLSATLWASLQQQAAPALAKYDAERRRADGDPTGADIDSRRAAADEAALGLTELDRERLQVALSSLGHEIGGVTGFIGRRTRAMIAAWQKTQGLAETGFLSAAQWAALRQQAAPALSRYESERR